MHLKENGIDFGDLTSKDIMVLDHQVQLVVYDRWWNSGSPSSVNIIDYVEIMTLGNALDFGDLTREFMFKIVCNLLCLSTGGNNHYK